MAVVMVHTLTLTSAGLKPIDEGPHREREQGRPGEGHAHLAAERLEHVTHHDDVGDARAVAVDQRGEVVREEPRTPEGRLRERLGT